MKFVWLVCPTNSGSTLLRNVLENCENVGGLGSESQNLMRCWQERNNEEVFPMNGYLRSKDRVIMQYADIWTKRENWNFEKYEELLKQFVQERNSNPELVVLKDIHNVLTVEKISQYFEENYFLVLVRHPVALAEGIKRRTHNVKWMDIVKHLKKLFRKLKQHSEKENSVLVRYEDFCENPLEVKERIEGLTDISLEGFETNKQFNLHNVENEKSGLKNFNEEQIKRLSDEKRNWLQEELSEIINLFYQKEKNDGKYCYS